MKRPAFVRRSSSLCEFQLFAICNVKRAISMMFHRKPFRKFTFVIQHSHMEMDNKMSWNHFVWWLRFVLWMDYLASKGCRIITLKMLSLCVYAYCQILQQ